VAERAEAMDRDELQAEIERLAPWHHNVELPGGLSTYVAGAERRPLDRRRLSDLVGYVWPPLLDACGGSLEGKRVLDVACNCGGFSLEAVESGAAYVLGIDVTPKYIEQANTLKRALSVDNADFELLSIEELDPERIGTFDVVLNFGILYHLENPVLAMKRLSAVSGDVMVVETALDRDGGDRPSWRMDILEPVEDADRIASTGLWRTDAVCQLFPTAHAVEDLLAFLGFSTVRRLEPPRGIWRPFLDGRRAAYLARR
jgi:2-polyprenyl-3-methyl-5-hydroxy-6-metoxy-1,4-benzoquinol methylase